MPKKNITRALVGARLYGQSRGKMVDCVRPSFEQIASTTGHKWCCTQQVARRERDLSTLEQWGGIPNSYKSGTTAYSACFDMLLVISYLPFGRDTRSDLDRCWEQSLILIRVTTPFNHGYKMDHDITRGQMVKGVLSFRQKKTLHTRLPDASFEYSARYHKILLQPCSFFHFLDFLRFFCFFMVTDALHAVVVNSPCCDDSCCYKNKRLLHGGPQS